MDGVHPLPWEPGGTPVALGPARRRWPLVALVAVAVLVGACATVAAVRSGGGREVSTPFLSYTAPAGWTEADAPVGVPELTGLWRGPGYACGGEEQLRGVVAAATLPPAAGGGPADRAADAARWFAAVTFGPADGAPAAVTLAPARPVTVAGSTGRVDAALVEATAHTAGGPPCAATAGTVLALAVPVADGVALLLVAGDTEGGPAEPRPPRREELDAVIASLRLR